MGNALFNRKHPRLDYYDYSSAGAYFITICSQNRKYFFSHITDQDIAPVVRGLAPANQGDASVVRGLAPANQGDASVVRGLAPAETNHSDLYRIVYTKYGQIAEQQLFLLESRFPHVKIDQYVIMPNHIHAIILLEDIAGASPRTTENAAGASPRATENAAGASPRATLMDVVCAYKSLTTRECKKIGLREKLFQTSFFEHIIRNRDDYNQHVKYIYENPMCWYYDELYVGDQGYLYDKHY